MILRTLLTSIFLAGVSVTVYSQAANNGSLYAAPDGGQVLSELTKISRSVQTLSDSFKVFTDKFENARSSTLSDKQQKMLLAMGVLVQAEQRVATFQNQQIELVDKLNDSRSKLAQNEIDLRPRSIDRSVQYEGTTETDELREIRRQKLMNERSTLTQLVAQIQTTLNEVNDNLREAQAFAYRLRRTVLPQIEKELSDQ